MAAARERRERHGEFHWNELMTRDLEAARAFYSALLGWTFTEIPMKPGDDPSMPGGGVYLIASAGDGPAAGLMTMEGPAFEGVPEHWFSYVAVDDVDARLATLKARGGSVMREPFDVPRVGRIAVARDAGGAAIGLIAPDLSGGDGP